MKKTIHLILLFAYSISATELHQLLKMPSLLEHFAEHKGLNNKITISEFLYRHYMLPDDGDNDQQQESKLPFKSHDGCTNIGSTLFITMPAFALSLKPFVTEIKSYNNYSTVFVNYSCLSAIWQPPKSC
jgi:hypothetical protein